KQQARTPQGTRLRTENPRVAVFFHPDCDRRLRISTGSADLPPETEALAGSSRRTYRRWGLPPRPEDVCRTNRPADLSTMRTSRSPAQAHPVHDNRTDPMEPRDATHEMRSSMKRRKT